ncbi:DUF3857 domain-containing protein [Chitinophaga vietnamensis]|uniref:DUF3857 domain-containing protein n=1 Tax=Chitinophaga vietnamensis TaxID=2593957 RepID=UPI0013763C1F|nr:DUF3857 domain-containing protein [Chitinophaga vietnamensis]
MQRLIFFLTLTAIFARPATTQAQVNNYFPDTWKATPTLHPAPDASQLHSSYTALQYLVIKDFNASNRDKADGYATYKTVYKNVRINSKPAADSLTQLVLELEQTEALRGFRVRAIMPDGNVMNYDNQTRSLRLKDDRTAIVVSNLALQPGCELEYEINLKSQFDYAGSEYIQSAIPCVEATFRAVAPKDLIFSFKSVNGLPDVTESISGNNHVYDLSVHNIPAIENSELAYTLPRLRRIDYALHSFVEGRDTTKVTWKQFGEEAYVPYVAVSKAEYKALEKEMSRLSFAQRRMPMAQLVYQVENFVKTNFTVDNPDEVYEPGDIIATLRTKRTDKIGYTRLMNAIYYMLNVPVQMLFTSARDTLPLDSQLVNRSLAKNVLLYFPTLGQALAPTETAIRFPCYPPMWINTLALRARDTLIGQESKVITDFIRTPLPTYTNSNITLEATLSSFKDRSWQLVQSFGGYPAANIREALKGNSSTERRNALLNLLLPMEPGDRRVTGVTMKNEAYNPFTDEPFVLNSTLTTPNLVLEQGNQLYIKIGSLLGGSNTVATAMPPAGTPAQIGFPFYQEKKLHIEIPAGYKVMNKADFSADISSKSNALGYKMRCEESGNQLHIYLIEWYRNTDFNDAEKPAFEAMMKRIKHIQQQGIILEKK